MCLSLIYLLPGFMMKMDFLIHEEYQCALQYLIAAALEVTDVNIFKPSGFTMGMNNWNIAQLRIFGNTALSSEKRLYNTIN